MLQPELERLVLLGLGEQPVRRERRSSWRCCAISNNCEHCTNCNCFIFFDQNLLNHTSYWTWDLGVDLVGGDLDEWFVGGHGVADLLEPARDGALGDGLTERGRVTETGMGLLRASGVSVQGLAGEGEERLAHGFVLCGVRMDQGGHVLGVGLPIDDELGLTDLLADARPDHVDADDRAVCALHELDEAGRGEDLALAVAPRLYS